jgi:hypothetical protein
MITKEQVRNILNHFHVSLRWHRAFCRLVIDHALDNRTFSRLVRRDVVYKTCLRTCLVVIAARDRKRVFGIEETVERALAIAG